MKGMIKSIASLQVGGGGGAKKPRKDGKTEEFQPEEVNFNELKLEKELGKGSFGIVYLSKWKGRSIAVKKINDNASPGDVQEFQAEIDRLRNMSPHRNIILFVGTCATPLCILLESISNGSVRDYLKAEAHKVNIGTMYRWALETSAGLGHMHSEGLVHRDMSARNLLLDEKLAIKICDFGQSWSINGILNNELTGRQVGPLKWLAPEALSQRVYTPKTDVWAYGITLIEIFTRKDPYPSLAAFEVAFRVGEMGFTHPIPNECPAEFRDLMQSCWRKNPAERPEIAQIFALCKQLCSSVGEKFIDEEIPAPHPDTYNLRSSMANGASAGGGAAQAQAPQQQPDLVRNAYGQMMQNYGDPEKLSCWHGVCSRQEAEGVVLRTPAPPGYIGTYLARISSASAYPAQAFAVTLCNNNQVAHVLVTLKEGGYGFQDQGALVYPTLNDLFGRDPVLSQSFPIIPPANASYRASVAFRPGAAPPQGQLSPQMRSQSAQALPGPQSFAAPQGPPPVAARPMPSAAMAPGRMMPPPPQSFAPPQGPPPPGRMPPPRPPPPGRQ